MNHPTTPRAGLPSRGVRAAAVAGVAALALAACAPDEPGAAAIVNGERITTVQVSQAAQGIRRGNPDIAQGQDLDQTVLFYLLVAPFLLPRAQQAGAGVSPSEAAAQLPRTSDPDPQSVRVLQTVLALQKLQQRGAGPVLQQVQQQIRSARIRVNPRFGRLDTTQLQLVPGQPNWLAPSAGSATGQPTTPPGP